MEGNYSQLDLSGGMMDSGGAEEWQLSGLRVQPKEVQGNKSMTNREDSDD